MRTITVALGEKTYNIEIAAGLLDQIGAKARVLSQAVKAGNHQRQQRRSFIWRKAGTQPGCQRV